MLIHLAKNLTKLDLHTSVSHCQKQISPACWYAADPERVNTTCMKPGGGIHDQPFKYHPLTLQLPRDHGGKISIVFNWFLTSSPPTQFKEAAKKEESRKHTRCTHGGGIESNIDIMCMCLALMVSLGNAYSRGYLRFEWCTSYIINKVGLFWLIISSLRVMEMKGPDGVRSMCASQMVPFYLCSALPLTRD